VPLVTTRAVRAQVLVGPGQSTETAFRREIRGHWFAWLAAQEDGDAALGRAKTDEIVRYAQKIGIHRLTDLALSATLLGRRELLAGKTQIAKESFDAAVKLDPDLPEARWGRVSLAARTRRWTEVPGALADALRATFKDVESRRITLARLGLILVLTIGAVGAAFVLVLVLAYAKLYVHDLSELAGGFVKDPATRRVLTAGLFLAPLLLSFDVVWLVLVLFVAVWGYATFGQRIAAAVGLAALLPVLPMVDAVSYRYATDASPILRGAEALAESRYDQRVLDNLEAVKNVLPEDVDVRFLLGCLYQALGQNDRAVTEYTTGANASPSESRCLVNRGNIHFVDGDFGSAQEDFQEALKRDARNVAARYNLALVYAETFPTVEAAEALQEARALDSRLVTKFQETPSVVKVVSLAYGVDDARKKIESLEKDSRSRRLLGHFRSAHAFNPFGVAVLPGILVAIGAAFLVARLRSRGYGYSSECQKCGRTFCRLCKPVGESNVLCSQCVHVYLKKDGVAIETKLQKLDEVKRKKRFSDRARLVANVVFPGSIAFLDSRVLTALLSLSLFFLGLVAAFGREAFGVVPRPFVTPSVVWTLPWLVVATAAWLYGQLSARKLL
jgi:tetratricopeptide (TPR) repeat protein